MSTNKLNHIFFNRSKARLTDDHTSTDGYALTCGDGYWKLSPLSKIFYVLKSMDNNLFLDNSGEYTLRSPFSKKLQKFKTESDALNKRTEFNQTDQDAVVQKLSPTHLRRKKHV